MQKYRIWLDDVRPMPEGFNIHCKSSKECLDFLFSINYQADLISFDHDLGENDTSIPVAEVLETYAYHGNINPIKWQIHSANPVGRRNLEVILRRADKYWDENLQT